jgi:hypothetical protein
MASEKVNILSKLYVTVTVLVIILSSCVNSGGIKKRITFTLTS